MVKEERKPQFFKFFIPGVNDKRLMIPSAFFKHLRGEHSGSASLIGPSGNIWHVDLVKNNAGVFLQSGWPEFARDHSVHAGYCLIFKYEGSLKFSVEIYDTSCCQKVDALRAKPSHHSTSYEDKKNLQTPCRTSKRDLRKSMTKQHTSEETVRSTKVDIEKMLHKVKPSFFTTNKAAVRLKNRKVPSQRRHVTQEEIDKAYERAMSFTSENPTHLIIMRKAYCKVGFYLALSKSFARFLSLGAATMVTLYDPSGKPWEVKYIKSRVRGNGAFSGGWQAFALG